LIKPGSSAGGTGAEEIALHFVAAVGVQKFQLLLGLDTFGDDLEIEFVSKGNDARPLRHERDFLK